METESRLGLRTYPEMGPATLVGMAADGYTVGMEKNTMKTTKVLLTGLLAALLLTPTAAQAKPHRKNAKAKSSHAAAEAKALVKAGLSHLEDQNYDAAISNFSKATKEGAESATYFLLGYAHYQRGFRAGAPETADKEDAMQTINAYAMAVTLDPELETVSEPYRLYHSLALSYEAVQSYDKAIEAYKMAFQAAPENPLLPLYASRLRYRMGDMPKATDNLALSLKKAKATNKDKALVKMIKTNPLFSMLAGNPALRESTGDDSEAPITIAQAAFTAGEEFRDSVRSAPDNRTQMMAAALPAAHPAVMEQLASADEQFRFRRYSAAIDRYNEALKLDERVASLSQTQLAILYERMGTSYNKMGGSAQAVRALQRSLQQMPNNTAAHYQIALAYAVAGKTSESLRALTEAFTSAPSAGELKRYMLLAKTDVELEAVRDHQGYAGLMSQYSDRLARR